MLDKVLQTCTHSANNQLTEQDGWALGNIGPDVTTFIYNLDVTLKEQDIDGGVNNGDDDGKGDYEGSNVPSTTTYSYDLRGQQIEEYTPANIALGTSAATIYSAYDTAGNRINENGSTFLIDDNNPTGYAQILDETNSNYTRSYVIGLEVISESTGNPASSNDLEYLLADGNNSTRQLINSAAAVISTWNYDGFGNTVSGYNQQDVIGGGRGRPVFSFNATDLTFQGGYMNPDGTIQMGITGGRSYDPVTGRFLDSDPMGNSFGPGDIANSDLYLFVDGDPRNERDPTGHSSLLLGTAVNNYLSAEFEGLVLPGHDLYGNRWIKTILNSRFVKAGQNVSAWSLGARLRPDAVDLYQTTSGSIIGDLYEFKPGPLSLMTIPGTLPQLAVSALADLAKYFILRTYAPNVQWQQGSSLWPGFTEWPCFSSPLQPPGTTLVTFDDYSAVKGVILYDFIPTQKALQLLGQTLTTAAAAALIYAGASAAAPYIAIGGELAMDLVSSFMGATLLAVEGGVA